MDVGCQASGDVSGASGSVQARQAASWGALGVGRSGRRVGRACGRSVADSGQPGPIGEMLLAGPSATLRGKLTEKVRYRPTAAIEPLLPAGTETLESLPVVRPGTSPADLVRSEPTEDELNEYCVAIRRTAAVFSRYHVKNGTLAEHDTYTVWVATYMCCPASALSSSWTMTCVSIDRTRGVAFACEPGVQCEADVSSGADMHVAPVRVAYIVYGGEIPKKLWCE